MSFKISIITATYNAASTLQNLIDSVIINKNSHMVEFIIIDGGSKDKTLEIIKVNEKYIDFWNSEPDKGIYDAWNKGIAKATGDWIMFLGADDELLPNAIGDYQEFLGKSNSKLDLVSSKLQMIDKNGDPVRIKGWAWEWPLFLKEVMIAHPGALHAKHFFEEFGNFDISYRITGDYELLLRPKEKLKTAFMNKVTVKMAEGGASDSFAAMEEHLKAAILTGGQSRFFGTVNYWIVFFKFTIKKGLRKLGVNAYLKK